MTARHRDEISHWSITDGRVAIGTVDLADDGAYVARDARGRVVGRYGSVKAATAALPVLR